MGLFGKIKSGITMSMDPADVFGSRAGEAANELGWQAVELQKQATKAAKALQGRQEVEAARYAQGLTESVGANAADYMALANKAAEAQAAKTAKYGTTQATRAALQAARSAGVNRGQAALTAAQQSAGTYGQQYQTGLEAGRNQYAQGADIFQSQANQANQNVLNTLNTQANIATGQQSYAGGLASSADAKRASAVGAIGSVAGMMAGGGAGGAVGSKVASDERIKTDVKPSSDLDAILAKIRPVDFKYKEGSGLPPEPEHKGVIAQDLEGTSLENAVKETPEGVKMIDSAELAPGVLNLVIQLADRVRELERGKK